MAEGKLDWKRTGNGTWKAADGEAEYEVAGLYRAYTCDAGGGADGEWESAGDTADYEAVERWLRHLLNCGQLLGGGEDCGWGDMASFAHVAPNVDAWTAPNGRGVAIALEWTALARRGDGPVSEIARASTPELAMEAAEAAR